MARSLSGGQKSLFAWQRLMIGNSFSVSPLTWAMAQKQSQDNAGQKVKDFLLMQNSVEQ